MIEHAGRLAGVVLAEPKLTFHGRSRNRGRLTDHPWPETGLDATSFVIGARKVVG